MNVDVLLGLHGRRRKREDCGLPYFQYDIIARFPTVAPMAGHSLKFDGEKIFLHTIPSEFQPQEKKPHR